MASNFWESDPVVSDQWWSKDPEIGKKEQAARKSTIGSEIVRGGKQLASSVQTGAESLFGSPEEAARAGISRSEKIGEAAGEGVSFEALKKVYEDKGLLSAAGEAISQVPRALAGQVPQLAAMAGGAKLGAMAGTAVAPGVGTVVGGALGAGATLLPQFFGSMQERQASEQLARGEDVKIDQSKAALGAAGAAALEGAGTAFTLGKGIVKGVLGITDDAALMTAKAQQSMKAAAERSLLQAAGRGAVKGAAVEMPVEVAQSVIERAQAGLDVTSPEAIKEYGEAAYQSVLVGGPLGTVGGATDTAMARQGVQAKTAFDTDEAKRVAEEAAVKQKPTPPSPAQAIEEQASELERQQQRQEAAMDRARASGIGGGSEVNQTLLDQARIRKEQQERAAAAQEKADEDRRKQELRAERARITNTQYSGDPMMNEVLRSRAVADFDAANTPKVEAPAAPVYQPTKTIEQTTPVTQPEGFNVLRGVDARNADLMSVVSERRAAEEAAAATQAKATEAKKVEEAAKADTSRADVDQRVAQVENFLMSPVRKTQQETSDYVAGVIPEMQKDFLALLDEDMSQPLTPEQTEALKTTIRQRIQPAVAQDDVAQRTPFKKFLASKGMNKQDAQDIFGENAYRANQQLPGAIRADAPRLDMLAEAAVEAGFLQQEDTEALVDMIKAEFGGDEQVSVDMAGDRAAAEYEARRESELEDRAAAIGLKTKGMTPDQVAARLDRIDRKREEKRKQYNRDIDGFSDLPTAEQDRIIDMMIDQFGEPQVFDVERAEIEGEVIAEQGLPPQGPEKETLEARTEKGGWTIDPEERRVEKELTGKDFMQVVQWAVDSAPNAFYRTIAQKVQARLKEYVRKGVEFDFTLHTGSNRSAGMRNRAGAVEFTWEKSGSPKNSKMEMHINGAAVIDNQAGYAPGVQYDTILHELLHAAIRTQTRFMPKTDPLYKELMALDDKVLTAFNEQAKAKTLPPVMMEYYRRENNILATPDELISWGMTDKGVQEWLDSIKVGEKSVLTKLVELMRKVLGLGKPYESAFEKLVRTTDSLLDIDVGSIEGNMSDQGFSMAVKKANKQAGKPVQQSLFREAKEGKPVAMRDETDKEARYSRDSITGKPILSQWTTPTDTKLAGDIGKDDLIYALQNKMIDTKRVVDAISSTAGKIMAKWNPYLQEELYHGRTAKQTKDFLTEELRPLMQAMEKAGVSIADMETYLKNRHAIAYNEHINKINPDPKLKDKGSGISTADAQAYLDGLSKDDKAKYEALAKRVDAITKGTRKLLVDSGLETKETIDSWEETFPFYVPLKRGDIDFAYTAGGMGTGQGFDVRGDFSRRAMGSEREAIDVLANVAMMRERAIVKAQKNRVAQALFGLAAQNPNPEFWLPVDPLAEVDPANMQELLNFGLSQADLDFIAKEPRQKAIDKSKNEVVERINATLRNNENVLSMRFNGENRYVFFNPNDPRAERMVKSLKNLDADQLGHVLGPISKITRWMASVNTQYNPIFGAYNFLRDVQGASLQLSDTPLAKDRKAVVGGTLPALKGIYSAMRAERDGTKATGPWADLWTEFQEQGGQTGFRDQFSRSQERAEALQAELNKIKEGKVKAAGRAMIDWLSDYNDSMENAVRLSAYKAAIDKGIGKEEAASIAKNLTVNFNRKGQVAVQAGALYAFFNAAMQGTTRLIQTLSGPAGKKIMAGGFLLGAMQASLLAAAGFDEEEPPEFVRERNLIIPIGDDKYIAFPMPLGYHVIPSTSRILTEWALSGFKDTPDRIASLTGMFLEAFNPIGNAGWSAQTLAPTFADPIVALTENRDWTGKPIARKDFSNLDPTPGYTRAKDTASEFSTQIAKFLNYASGGTEFKPGVLSPTPDQIDYLIGQGTGGLGREALKVEQTITKTATGEELPPYKIPLVGRFYGETKSSAAESNRFYKNLTKLNEHENEIKGRRASGQPTAEYMAENPEARLAALGRKTYTDIQKLRKRKEQLVERDAPRESVQAVEKMITQRMQTLNERVNALSK